LVSDLGASDKRKVDEYLTAIREVEYRIGRAENDTRLPPVEKPSGIPFDYADYVKLMFDLQAIAFQSDLTRVSTMMLGREGSVRTYPEIGVPDPHHPLTHHHTIADTRISLKKWRKSTASTLSSSPTSSRSSSPLKTATEACWIIR
jgi:hypothetical protein